FLSYTHDDAQCCQWRSLDRRTQARIEKPKVAGATQGEPLPSVTAIVVNGGTTEARALVCLHLAETKSDCLCRDQLGSVSAESDSASAEESQSNTNPLYAFDPEIELTLRRLRKNRNTIVDISTNIFSEPGQMENHDRTLKELATPDVVYQPWCIQYPQLEPAQTYELKSGLIHLLPKFHGLAGEDPHKHLKEFHVVCSTMRP
ncbi:hypothetical protein CR513_18484, partial [Mucuna pruriens]